MDRWTLYVDETGTFEAPLTSAVVGVLARGSPDHHADRRDRQAIERAHPGVVYPPHAADLRAPTAMIARQRRGPPAFQGPLGLAVDRAWAAVQTDPTPDVAAWRRALVARERARATGDRAAVRAQQHALQTHRAATDRWLREQGAAEPLEAASRRLAAGLGALADRWARERDAGAVVVGATLPKAPASYGVLVADGYLHALDALFRRVVLLLAEAGAPAEVDVVVATRDVEHARGLRAPLHPAFLQQVVHRTYLPLGRPPEVVLVPFGGTLRWDDRIPAGLVLADHCAFRCRAVLEAASDRDDALPALEEKLRHAGAPLPVRRALPALAADGEADHVVAAAHRGEPVDASRVRPRWNREQAEEWVACLSR